jgi:tetratricopeptide (TPR) repeat protein
MNTTDFRNAAIAGALALGLTLVVGGCKSDAEPKPVNDGALSQYQPDPWDAGADRKPTANTMFALAQILIDQNRDRDALQVLGQILQQYPHYQPAYNEAAAIYVRSGRLADATTTLQAGLRQEPRDPVLHNNLGMVWFVRGDYEQSLEHFTTSVKVAPDNPTYRANQAAALGMLGRDAEALEAYHGVVSGAAAQDNLRVLALARQKELHRAQLEPSGKSTAGAAADVPAEAHETAPGTQPAAGQPGI